MHTFLFYTLFIIHCFFCLNHFAFIRDSPCSALLEIPSLFHYTFQPYIYRLAFFFTQSPVFQNLFSLSSFIPDFLLSLSSSLGILWQLFCNNIFVFCIIYLTSLMYVLISCLSIPLFRSIISFSILLPIALILAISTHMHILFIRNNVFCPSTILSFHHISICYP